VYGASANSSLVSAGKTSVYKEFHIRSTLVNRVLLGFELRQATAATPTAGTVQTQNLTNSFKEYCILQKKIKIMPLLKSSIELKYQLT